MPVRGELAEHKVRFGATVTAVARAIVAAWPLFLAAWAAHWALEVGGIFVRTAHPALALPHLAPLPILLMVTVPTGGAVVTGLTLRWLLNPTAAAFRPDWRLAAYVAIIAASFMASAGLDSVLLFAPSKTLVAMVHYLLPLSIAGTTVLDLIYVLLALWPVAILMGDKLSLGEAARLMRQAYLVYLVAIVVLFLPGVLLVPLALMAHHAPRSLADRVWGSVIGSCASTISTFVLAQVYARRVRGGDIPRSAPGPTAAALA